MSGLSLGLRKVRHACLGLELGLGVRKLRDHTVRARVGVGGLGSESLGQGFRCVRLGLGAACRRGRHRRRSWPPQCRPRGAACSGSGVRVVLGLGLG